MTRNRFLCQGTLLLLLLAGSAGVMAQSPPANAPPDRHRGHREALPDSVRRVERETGGEVLRAEPMQRDGREVYRIKVLTADGRVRVMQDDPNARQDESNGRRGEDSRRRGDAAAAARGDGKRGTGGKQRPSRDPDGEPQQF
jgi:hypothetical protein